MNKETLNFKLEQIQSANEDVVSEAETTEAEAIELLTILEDTIDNAKNVVQCAKDVATASETVETEINTLRKEIDEITFSVPSLEEITRVVNHQINNMLPDSYVIISNNDYGPLPNYETFSSESKAALTGNIAAAIMSAFK